MSGISHGSGGVQIPYKGEYQLRYSDCPFHQDTVVQNTECDDVNVQERPLVERLDEILLSLVAQTMPDASMNGLEFLAYLCRLAVVKQQTLLPDQHAAVAVIVCHGITDLVKYPGWKWSRETTLILLQALEALTVLVRFRRACHTEIHLPLGTREIDLSIIQTRIARSPYTSKKARRFFTRLSMRAQQVSEKASLARENTPIACLQVQGGDRCPSWGAFQEQLQNLLEEEDVPVARRKRILLRLDQMYREMANVPSPTNERAIPVRAEKKAGPLIKPARKKRKPDGYAAIAVAEQEEEELRMERACGSQPSSSTGQLDKEAYEIWQYLCSPEQQQTPRGRRRLQEIRAWLEVHPDLVRAAMITTLMQCYFPDRHGPLRDPGSWFVSTYQRYQTGTLSLSANIASWVASPYSYPQIEEALIAERKFQEHCLLPAQRPDSSCIHRSAHIEEEVLAHTRHEASSFAFQDHLQWSNQRLEPPGECSTPPSLEKKATHSARERSPESEEDGPRERRPCVQIAHEVHSGIGWQKEQDARWWYDRLQGTPLRQTHQIRLLPTPDGCWVIRLTSLAEAAQTWVWTKGTEVRAYLESRHIGIGPKQSNTVGAE